MTPTLTKTPVALLITNSCLQKLLCAAFDQVEQTYVLIRDVQDINQQDYELLICDHVPEYEANKPIIGILTDNMAEKAKNSSIFTKILCFPIRLGGFIDDINYFLQHNALKQISQPKKMGAYTLYPAQNKILTPFAANKISITDKEVEILLYLNEQGKKVDREALLQAVWGYAQNVETHTLETHIYRLRQKIEEDPTNPQFLMTDEEGYFLRLSK